MEWINETASGLTVKIRAIPRASKNEIQGIYDDALKVRLTTAPVDGKANQALIRFLSKALKISKAQFQIAQGETSRHKVLRITGISKEELMKKIGIME